MHGWIGNILRINLTSKSVKTETYDEEFAKKWVGGRGFAIKILYDELKPGIDPLGPDNKFVVALGPIAGVPAPNTGKTVVAAKSPITGGYGDGNLGSRVTEHLRRAGFDVLIVEGKAEKPTYIEIVDDKVQFLSAEEIWGKGSYDAENWLYAKYGKSVGILTTGQAGDKMALYAVVRSLEGRAGGRPGMGAVMGSKNLKAIVVKGTKEISMAAGDEYKKLGAGDLKKVHELDKQSGWSKQSTNGVLAWCNEVAALPVRNMRKTHSSEAWKVDGERLDNARIATYGCPNCTMRCGITIHDKEGRESELDYENVGLLGPNLEIYDLAQVGSLNYLCDDYGLDTISAGNVLGLYADAIDRGAVDGDFKFGDAEKAKLLLGLAADRKGEVGNFLADGCYRMAKKFGKNTMDYAMQVKGLEISAYNCKFIPGMAMAFGVSPIGAHHKEAWVITYEIKQTARDSYGIEKPQKIIDLQRIRGGLFEFIVACRFPWVELGWDLENYAIYFNKATGLNWTLQDMWKVGDRIYNLMKLFWLRENPDWNRTMDYPPKVWFDPENADTEGPIAGKILDLQKYDEMLGLYYDLRGWDNRGIPTKQTAEAMGLAQEAADAERYGKLTG